MSMFPDVASLVEKRREFSEERILGYSPERVYDVVADLNRYKEFLPWCQESRYIREGPERSYGQLSIGFPPLLERYTAMVVRSRPSAIRVSMLATVANQLHVELRAHLAQNMMQ
jgi:coenzyme Q-binding protein COQ10